MAKKDTSMPIYTPSNEERKWYIHCVRNNIRISPQKSKKADEWHIAISVGPYKKGEQPKVSPKSYGREEIWQTYYKFCKYYFDKR